jgi:hypothetical protein
MEPPYNTHEGDNMSQKDDVIPLALRDDGTLLAATFQAFAAKATIAPGLEEELAILLASWKRLAGIPGGPPLLANLFGEPFGCTDESLARAGAVSIDTVQSIKMISKEFGDVITWIDCIRILNLIGAVRAEMDCLTHPIRWIARGVLNGQGLHVETGSIIDDPNDLAKLGASRIRELISTGQAELVVAGE